VDVPAYEADERVDLIDTSLGGKSSYATMMDFEAKATVLAFKISVNSARISAVLAPASAPKAKSNQNRNAGCLQLFPGYLSSLDNRPGIEDRCEESQFAR
jgi:hypothetical protein